MGNLDCEFHTLACGAPFLSVTSDCYAIKFVLGAPFLIADLLRILEEITHLTATSFLDGCPVEACDDFTGGRNSIVRSC